MSEVHDATAPELAGEEHPGDHSVRSHGVVARDLDRLIGIARSNSAPHVARNLPATARLYG